MKIQIMGNGTVVAATEKVLTTLMMDVEVLTDGADTVIVFGQDELAGAYNKFRKFVLIDWKKTDYIDRLENVTFLPQPLNVVELIKQLQQEGR